MNISVRNSVVVLLATVVMLLAYFYVDARPEAGEKSSNTKSDALRGSGEFVSATQTRAASKSDFSSKDVGVVSQGSGGNLSELRKAYFSSTDLRLFIEAAKRSSTQGAWLYITNALTECGSLRESWLRADVMRQLDASINASTEGVAAKRRAQLDRLRSRCESFTADEISNAEEERHQQWGKASDELLKLRQVSISPPKSLSDRAALLSKVIDARDPLLMRSAVGLASSMTSSGMVTYVDGAKFGGSTAEEFHSAWILAVCEYTNNCTENTNISLVAACAFEGQCFDSVKAMIFSEAKEPETQRQILGVSKRILEIFESKDIKALLPPQ